MVILLRWLTPVGGLLYYENRFYKDSTNTDEGNPLLRSVYHERPVLAKIMYFNSITFSGQ